MKKIKLGLAVISVCIVSSSVFAADGTIIFKGELVNSTCTPTVTSGGTPTGGSTVTLPKVSISALKTAAQTAGQTAFAISLDGGTTASCKINDIIGKPYFEPEMSKVDYTTGTLKNTAAPADTAKQVNIQLLNNSNAAIDLSKDSSGQIYSAPITTGNVYKYDYAARYYALAATEAGEVTASVSYTIIYK